MNDKNARMLHVHFSREERVDKLIIWTPQQNIIIKKFTCKGTLQQVFVRRHSQSCWHFDPALWTVATLLSGSTLHPLGLPLPVSKYSIYTDIVWLGGGGRCWVLLETIFRRSLTLCIWPDPEPTKLVDPPPPQNINLGGGMPQTDKHLPQSPFTGQFFRWRHFALASI